MTRNLALCVLPTVIALLAVYWYRKKKKIKSKDYYKDTSDVYKTEDVVHDLTADNSSDSANTLSDASSFASPVSSEKSLRSSSPSYTSPLHNSADNIHTAAKLSNYINENNITDLSFSLKDGDFNKLNNLHSDISNITDSNCELLELSNSNWEKFENIETEAFDKMTQLGSLNNIDHHEKSVNISSAVKRNNCLKQENRVRKNSYNYDDIILQDVDNEEHCRNLNDYSIFSELKECKKSIENDNHSSVFDENSLSYVSDDSDYKHLTECKNKDSLSSVLDENSLMSSFCDELEKSSDSNSPSAKPDQYDSEHSISPKETHSFMPSKDLNLLLSPEFSKIELNSSNLAEDNHNNDDKCKLVTNTDTKLLNSFLDYNSIKSAVHELCNETDCDSGAAGDTVQNIFSKLDKSVLTPLKSETTCDNCVSAVNLKCSLKSNCSNFPESDSSAPNPNSLYVNTVCNSESHLNCSDKTSSEISSDDSALTSDVTSNGKAENHLEAAADVVHRISSDLSTSFSALLTNNSSPNAWNSPNFKSSLKWSPSLSKKEFTSKSFTSNSVIANVDSKPTCDTDESSLSKESVCSNETSNVFEESKVLNTDSSALLVDSNEENQNLSSSSSSVVNENHLKVVKSSKKETNGIGEIKASQPMSEYVYEFELAQELCGRLIGKHGKHVKSIIERSNANVFIKRHPYDPQLKVVVVEGDRSDVKEALDMIRRKYPPSQFPNVTLVQTNVISTSGVPMPDSLQLHLPEGASCDVILSSLVSAGHFFLQQPTHPTYPSLSTLDQCMIGLYSQMDTPLLPQPIEAGVICAAPVYRGWYRAQVVYVCENETDCGIKFVDYGGFSQVNISTLRQIRSDFMSLPFQASECYLAHVRPVAGDTWTAEATSVFEELAQGQILQALLMEYAEDGIPCVYLYRVTGVTNLFINKELVERGLAVWANSNHWDPH